MARDRYERRHRRTAKNKNAKAVMASADFSGTDLSTAMGLMMTDVARQRDELLAACEALLPVCVGCATHSCRGDCRHCLAREAAKAAIDRVKGGAE